MKQIGFTTTLILIFCFAIFSQIKVEQNSSLKIDEFEMLTECEEGARLDNFLIELSKNKNSKGVIIFRAKTERENYRRLFRVDSYLYFREADKSQISYLMSSNDKLKIELWTTSENSEIPDCKDCKIIKATEFRNPINNKK